MEITDYPLLLEKASEAMQNAYAPYSRFKVGAAVLGSKGGIYAGCNVENSSYPVGMCAERGAIAAAVVAGETQITALVIVTDTDTPCPLAGCVVKPCLSLTRTWSFSWLPETGSPTCPR